MTRPAGPLRSLSLFAGLALACSNGADRTAKERIFSPEEPAEDLARAAEPISASDVAIDADVLHRVLAMDGLEATRRLGAHRATTDLQYRWTRAGRTVALTEKDELFAAASGEFRAVSQNDQDAGFEVVFAGGRAYAKSRYGPFKARRLDRAQQDTWRNRATPGLSTLAALVGRRLHLSPLGEVSRAGRKARQFAFVLGEPWGPEEKGERLPPVVYGGFRVTGDDKLHPGPDPDTARRLDFQTRRLTEALSGELFVDEETGVVLAAKARARFSVPGLLKEPPATLDLDVSFEAAPDAKIRVSAPEDVAQARLPHAVNDPLWFLGEGAPPTKTEEDEPAGAAEPTDAADDDASDTTPAPGRAGAPVTAPQKADLKTPPSEKKLEKKPR